mmetsp:Transcript_97086/g.172818  ORF Transcript_97086/g.172818 Transcript_97086/m.172818 type:complete len:415 (+) Transcript_97086:51-1295(+)
MAAMASGSSAPKKGKKMNRMRKGPGVSNDEKNGAFRPYHSVSVPKSVDLHSQFQIETENRPKTTIMLRNIPNRYTQATLLQQINKVGFEGTYDFFYLPMDTQNRTNVGYAFINFVSPEELDRFTERFADYRFEDHASQKVARVSLAHIQGFVENIRHFSHRAVTQSRNSQYRPIVIHEGVRMDLSEAYDLLCNVQPNLQGQTTAGSQFWAENSEQGNSKCLANTLKRPLRPGPTSTGWEGPAPAGPVLPPRGQVPQTALRPGLLWTEPGPLNTSSPSMPPPAPAVSPVPAREETNFSFHAKLVPEEDCGHSFVEARLGFEAAISQLLRQNTQCLSSPPGLRLPRALGCPPGLKDGDETSTEDGSVDGSRAASPRGHASYEEKFDGCLQPGLLSELGERSTPRTNRTLLVHRFST